MQSGKVYDKQYGTLKITDSKEKMEARVKEIRKLFPTARYVNNHTGSAFTDDYKAMEILYSILRKEGFIFVDSRTTASTKVRKIAHAFGDAYVATSYFDAWVESYQFINFIWPDCGYEFEVICSYGDVPNGVTVADAFKTMWKKIATPVGRI